MRATIEFDDVLYRRLKVEAVRRGRTGRGLVSDAVRYSLDATRQSVATERHRAVTRAAP